MERERSVALIRSILAGTTALLVETSALALWQVWLHYKIKAAMGESFYVEVHWHMGPLVGVSFLVFVIGFLWQY